MKLTQLFGWLIFIIIIIIILGGVIVIIIIRGPVPDPPCAVCGFNVIKPLGIAEVVLGIVSLGLINRIRNIQKG
jgi:hypothetical protein